MAKTDYKLSKIDLAQGLPTPAILHAHAESCNPDWRWDSAKNQWGGFHIWFIDKGQGEAVYKGKTYPLAAGSCFLLRMWERFVARQDPKNPLFVMAMHFDYPGKGNNGPARKIPGLPQRYRKIASPAFFRQLLKHGIDAFLAGAGHEGRAIVWLRASLAELEALDRREAGTASDSPMAQIIRKFCEEAEADISRRIQIKQWVAENGLSVDYFIRCFKKQHGLTPKNYTVNAKVERAKNLLLFSDFSISRIAELLGYHDIYEFSKQYKEKTGNSPRQYRRFKALG